MKQIVLYNVSRPHEINLKVSVEQKADLSQARQN